MNTQTDSNPYRVGVLSTVAQADEAVHKLRAADFTKSELHVVCSDEAKTKHFSAQETASPAGAHTPRNIAAGWSRRRGHCPKHPNHLRRCPC